MKTFFGVCAAVLLLAATGSAANWKLLRPEGYVSDFAHVIDARSKAELNQYAAQVEQATGAQFAFVTLPSLQGEPIEDVANDLFHAWGVGQKKEDNGLMFLLSIQDRRSRLEVGGGLGGAIPDGMAGLLLDEMRPALRQQQYGPAFLMAAQRLGESVAQSKGVTIAPPRILTRTRPVTRQRGIPVPLILFGIFILLMLLRGGSGRYGGGGGGGFWAGMLLGEILGGGRRGGGWGGGFGGYDSGGSGGGFGGFGGGDSGGGGASSDW